MSEHTPLPWAVDPAYTFIYKGDHPIADCDHGYPGEDEANAALIVKAVNAHDDLVRALKWASTVIRPGSDLHNEMMAALAKAES